MNIREKFKSRQAKKKLKYSLAAIGLSAVAVLTVAVSSAFMTARTEKKTNEFKPYTVTNTTAVEKHGDKYEPSGGEYQFEKNGETGTTTNKNFSVANPKGARMKAVYVRVYPVITGAEKKAAENSAYEELTSVEIDDSSSLNNGWEKGKDGYYYYQYVLEPGYRTPDLFKNGEIHFKNIATDDKEFNLTFIADTVQAWPNGSKTVDKQFVTKAWGENPGAVDPGDPGVTLNTDAGTGIAQKLSDKDVLD